MLWLNRIGMFFEFLSFWLIAPETVTALLRDEGRWLDSLRLRTKEALPRLRLVLLVVSTGIAMLMLTGMLISVFSPSTANSFLEPPALATLLGVFIIMNVVLAFGERQQILSWVSYTKHKLRRWYRLLMLSTGVAIALTWVSVQNREPRWVLLAIAGVLVVSLAQRLMNKVLFLRQVTGRDRAVVLASIIGWYVIYMWFTLSDEASSSWLITVGQITLTAYLVFVFLLASLPILLRSLASSETLRRQLFMSGIVLFVFSFLFQFIATF